MKRFLISTILFTCTFALCQQIPAQNAERQNTQAGSRENCGGCFIQQDSRDTRPVADMKLSDWGQLAALLAAAVYFGFKTLSGYLISDMSVKASCERKHGPDGLDYLAVSVTVKKGERGGVIIHDAQARVTPSVPDEPQELIGIRKLVPDTAGATARITWKQEPEGLNMPPGDEMQFASMFKVPCRQPCRVEVVILARKFLQFKGALGQWHACCISLPHDDHAQSEKA